MSDVLRSRLHDFHMEKRPLMELRYKQKRNRMESAMQRSLTKLPSEAKDIRSLTSDFHVRPMHVENMNDFTKREQHFLEGGSEKD